MQVRKLAVTSVLAAASWTAFGLASPALALCDSYSGGCPSTPPTTPPTGGGGGGEEQPVGGVDEQPGTGVDEPTDEPTEGSTGGTPVRGNSNGPGTVVPTPASLPFTGGELVLMTAIGAGALAGGTALVIAGRRRTATA